jgi:hypothetical protein
VSIANEINEEGLSNGYGSRTAVSSKD